MVKLPDALTMQGLSANMLLQVHDELIFEVPDAEADKTVEVIKEVMQTAHQPVLELSVPLVVDAGIADSWADAH